MIYDLWISEGAENDIREIFLWYEMQKENLGFEFEMQIDSTIALISQNPFLIQIRYNQIRVAFLNRFPYGIHFILNGNQILIIAVFHTSRNPAKWPKTEIQ